MKNLTKFIQKIAQNHSLTHQSSIVIRTQQTDTMVTSWKPSLNRHFYFPTFCILFTSIIIFFTLHVPSLIFFTYFVLLFYALSFIFFFLSFLDCFSLGRRIFFYFILYWISLNNNNNKEEEEMNACVTETKIAYAEKL